MILGIISATLVVIISALTAYSNYKTRNEN